MSEVRRRRPTSWAVIELTRLGERKAEDGTLAPLLRAALSLSPSHPVFIPSKTYTSGGRKVTIHLMEGYAFVASDGAEIPHLSRTDQPYVKRMLTVSTPSGSKILSVVSDAVILDMEANLAAHVGEEARIGTWVSVTSGLYAKMDGEVVDCVPSGNLIVRFRMRSLDTIVEIPRSLIVPCDSAE
jgi:hypothetical protein